MKLTDFYSAATEEEFAEYGKLRFAPINVDYFINLYEWHQETVDSLRLLEKAESPDVKEALKVQKLLVALLHTATYPYVKHHTKSEAWKTAVYGWLSNDKLVSWFMEYFQESLPSRKGKSKTPGSSKRQRTSPTSTGASSTASPS